MTFQFDKLTVKAQESVARAQSSATTAGNPQIDTLHLLDALVGEDDGVVRPLLDAIGVEQSQLLSIVQAELDRLPKVSGGSQPQPNAELMKVLEASATEAETWNDDFVSTEHLLLALVKCDGAAKRILELNGLREKDVTEAIRTIRGSHRVTDQNPEDKYPGPSSVIRSIWWKRRRKESWTR